ncbi:MAG: thioesterase, partial [Actinobacteria bacterium]|nr:thioesterase [Actinomycetota bacterium]
LLADPELLAMVLPAIRADFGVKESYQYVAEAPLGVPITVLSSTDDPRAPHETQRQWREETLGSFTLRTLPGAHFAVFEQPRLTRAELLAALSGWL